MSTDLDAIEAHWSTARLAGIDADDAGNGWTSGKIRAVVRSWQDIPALVAEVERLSRRLGMTRDNAADDLAELRAENERLRAVAEAARGVIRTGSKRAVDCATAEVNARALDRLRATLDAWRAGGGAS